MGPGPMNGRFRPPNAALRSISRSQPHSLITLYVWQALHRRHRREPRCVDNGVVFGGEEKCKAGKQRKHYGKARFRGFQGYRGGTLATMV